MAWSEYMCALSADRFVYLIGSKILILIAMNAFWPQNAYACTSYCYTTVNDVTKQCYGFSGLCRQCTKIIVNCLQLGYCWISKGAYFHFHMPSSHRISTHHQIVLIKTSTEQNSLSTEIISELQEIIFSIRLNRERTKSIRHHFYKINMIKQWQS